MMFLHILTSQFLLCTVIFILMLYCAVTFVLDVYLCKGASQYYLSFYESTDQYMHFVMNLKLFW